MVKIYFTAIAVTVLHFACLAQNNADTLKRDSAKHLAGMTVRGYLIEQPVLSVPASVSVLSPELLKLQPGSTLVPALNTVPGVRMEERSPGSYRLSVRGSLLRSPFGVRDLKIYFDEIPLTDAGGNTYLNAIEVNSVQGVEILKGPDGSLFGANSGGVVLISPTSRNDHSNYLTAGLSAGSYGLFHQTMTLQSSSANNVVNLSDGYQTAAGYRQHSNMDRSYLQLTDKLTISNRDRLKFLGFYSELNYQTPGGLNLAQYNANPQQARLPTPVVPGAIQQKIGIQQKMFLGGLVNEAQLGDRVKNVLSVFGSYVDFANPFITNYEQRYEGTYGLRTYFEFSGRPGVPVNWKINLGLEWQQTNSDINNYGNRQGVKDTAQTLDKINSNQHFIFARYLADINRKWHIEAALSFNFYDYKFRNVYPNNEADFTNRKFTDQLMPRLALSYQITNNFIWRASVSRGYSTPTTAEIRPTDNVINTNLQAEYGWNYETGFRLRNADESMFLDASVYYYRLSNTIVPRFNADETEYYTNAGDLSQPGLELYFTDWLIRRNDVEFIRGLQFNLSLTVNRFKFVDYNNGTANYSGNKLTGAPSHVIVASVQLRLPSNLYLFVSDNYTSAIPLNDANTAYAGHYNLVQAKAGWELMIHKMRLGIFAGVDNVLNEKYSLGDDLNAVGNRYYNASAPRNYYMGINASF